MAGSGLRGGLTGLRRSRTAHWVIVGPGELRLPNRGDDGDPPSRLVALAALVVALGICAGVAAVGVRISDPSRVQATATSGTGPGGQPGAVAPGSAAPTSPTPHQPITATGTLGIIADDIHLPNESDGAWSGTNYDIALCAGARPGYSTLRRANDLRVVNTLSDDPQRTQVIAIAADENQARQIVQELSQPFRTCRLGGQEAATVVERDITGEQWQGGASYVTQVTDPGARDPYIGYLVVGRAGRAVVAQTIVGRSLPHPDGGRTDPGLDAAQQSFLDAMAPQVCRYRNDGCYTPPPPPYAPPDGSVLLDDGTWLLPDQSVVAPDGTVLVPAPQPDPSAAELPTPDPAAPAPAGQPPADQPPP